MRAMLCKIKNAIFSQAELAPGKSIQVSTQVIGNNTDDAELYHSPGFFSRPFDNIHGVVLDAGDNNIIVATHDYSLEFSIDKGEALLYSKDDNGDVIGTAKVDKLGNFIVNDGERTAVAFAELQTGFEQLKIDFNALVTAYNSHTHPVPLAQALQPASTPVSSVTATTGTPSTASIDDSEVEEVLLP